MALKPHQKVIMDDINHVCEAVADAGCVVTFTTTGVKKTGNLGDKVAGILLQDVVAGIHPSNISLSEYTGTINQARNFQKNQTHVSGVVRLMKVGELYTNACSGTINKGNILKAGAAGNLVVGGSGETVGHALEDKDSDGYVKVYINIA